MKCKDEGSKETSIDHDVVIFVPVYKILNAIKMYVGRILTMFQIWDLSRLCSRKHDCSLHW